MEDRKMKTLTDDVLSEVVGGINSTTSSVPPLVAKVEAALISFAIKEFGKASNITLLLGSEINQLNQILFPTK